MALAGLMISDFSAGCECRIFGTGLVMSENASDCTQNAAFRDRKLKNFLGRGTAAYPDPSPLGRGTYDTTYKHSFNEILIATFTRLTQQCHFE